MSRYGRDFDRAQRAYENATPSDGEVCCRFCGEALGEYDIDTTVCYVCRDEEVCSGCNRTYCKDELKEFEGDLYCTEDEGRGCYEDITADQEEG